MKFAARLLVFTVLALGLASPALARECEGVEFPNAVTVDGTRLTLNGMGVREATVLNVNVYVAALYVENRSRDGAAIAAAEEKKRLVLRFVREVEGSDIRDAFAEGFRQAGGGDQAAITRINGWMPNSVAEGDTFTFTYVPGTGLSVTVNRQNKGTIEGADFARAFFSIWLGAHPPNAGLKSGLLGGSCG
jgi:hypothetical protein